MPLISTADLGYAVIANTSEVAGKIAPAPALLRWLRGLVNG